MRDEAFADAEKADNEQRTGLFVAHCMVSL